MLANADRPKKVITSFLVLDLLLKLCGENFEKQNKVIRSFLLDYSARGPAHGRGISLGGPEHDTKIVTLSKFVHFDGGFILTAVKCYFRSM